jgi:hypothetical protein
MYCIEQVIMECPELDAVLQPLLRSLHLDWTPNHGVTPFLCALAFTTITSTIIAIKQVYTGSYRLSLNTLSLHSVSVFDVILHSGSYSLEMTGTSSSCIFLCSVRARAQQGRVGAEGGRGPAALPGVLP